MNTGKTLFARLMDFLPWTTFARYVQRYAGDRRARTLACGLAAYTIEALAAVDDHRVAPAGMSQRELVQPRRNVHHRPLPVFGA